MNFSELSLVAERIKLYKKIKMITAQMFATVSKVQNLNEVVTRLTLTIGESHGITDVYSEYFKVNTGDNLNICIHETFDKSNVKSYVMNGFVYKSSSNFSWLSCGGLLLVIPVSLELKQNVFIEFTKSNTRRRTHDNQIRPNTRQRKAS